MNVDKLVDKCYNLLPYHLRQRPWTVLNHGYDVLDSDDKLNAYIASYGEMHINKCRKAMQNFPFEDFVTRNSQGEIASVREFEIFDWGCGQGLGTLTFLELLSERKILHGVTRINLIDPSGIALNRASDWVCQATNPSTEVRTYSRYIPKNGEPVWDDIECDTKTAVHIFSNILDVREVGLQWLAFTTNKLGTERFYICVGPQYRRGVSRIEDFYNYLGHPQCFSDLTMYPCGYTSQTKHPFGIEVKSFKISNQTAINANYEEQSNQVAIDEFSSGEECLYGILSEDGIKAYKTLRESSSKYFNLYLRPSIGVERPDFVLENITRGIVLINICEDINEFEKDFDRIEAVKQALFDTYIKSLKISSIVTSATYNCIKTGLFFINASEDQINNACSEYYQKLLQRNQKNATNQGDNTVLVAPPNNPTEYLIKLTKDNCSEKIKGIQTKTFPYQFYNEAVSLILGKWHPYSAGDLTLKLTETQKSLVTDDKKWIRVKGVAGSGKTEVVAHKAVHEHLRTGQKVLIVTYNISLIQYIKMRINKVPADFSANAFDIINYHQFFWSKARRYHGRYIPLTASNDPNFFDDYIETIIQNEDQYETIIVDEAQDYMPAWFDILRKYFLKPEGGFFIFGDGEQNIYNREQDETTRMPRVPGFSGRWREMNEDESNNSNQSNRVSKRIMNPQITFLAYQFAREYNISSEGLYTEPSLNLFDYHMGYWNTHNNPTAPTLAQNILWILHTFNLEKRDTVVLAQGIEVLRETEHEYREISHCQATTTYESKKTYNQIKNRTLSPAQLTLDLKAIRRVAKVHFTTDTENLKFATISSFKGWESKNIILLLQKDVNDINDTEEDGFLIQTHGNINALIYTALTRARENLFIINLGNDKYHKFFNNAINNDL